MLVIHEIINQEVTMGTKLFACWRPFTKPPLVMVYRFVYKYSTLIDIINYCFSLITLFMIKELFSHRDIIAPITISSFLLHSCSPAAYLLILLNLNSK